MRYLPTLLLILTTSTTLLAQSPSFTNSSISPTSAAPNQTVTITSTLIVPAPLNGVSACAQIFAPNGYNFGNCQNLGVLAAGSFPISLAATIPVNANVTTASYPVTLSLYLNNPWTIIAQQSDFQSLTITVPTFSFSASTLAPVQTSPNGTITVTSTVTASAALANVSICAQLTAPSAYTFQKCQPFATLPEGSSALSIPIVIPNNPNITPATYPASLYLYWDGASQPFAQQLNFQSLSIIVPGPAPTLLFDEEFNSLNLASAANPNGTWRPNDYWQDLSSGGYIDFAATNWDIDPNDPTFAPYTPFTVSKGVLSIQAFRTPAALVAPIEAQMALQGVSGTAPAWCGGVLILNPAYKKLLFGYIEIRARFPIFGKGMFPALWLYDSGNAPPAKGGSEIDILEMFGLPNDFYTTLHLGGNANDGIGLGNLNTLTAQWHTYSLDWQPTYLNFYLDDTLIYQVTGAKASWFTTPMGIRLNYAMNAPWFPPAATADSSTPNDLTLQVDYVRVYDRKPTLKFCTEAIEHCYP